ncbi:Lysine-specific demethylase JMJ30 [Fulvia fulva]|uniref:Lysine-specific demethylase JMJ30 n=1 Tax=Passalora fulva TaxID=5499 RepID=A0A9Q8L5N6_PASFU|nr:Lysine-specific demethylase JMJ30 [Fulvia fulva]KAK4635418.1 Lysine-specific demethylase JMJ30 [Fulvia fulva]KAK4637686.1 Lysine-specific demethylase JMJ30 [Fulvia fulva]UJO11331.1 Lysine-specific demethylase JMJ30 [Fulvia fulva]WPV08596.1 Lysine-specific demethylase JMJ30 [Fulvia fulva]WPV24772.1 Lysine-specific demethylase JMJ30 [Fulvia fulva]
MLRGSRLPASLSHTTCRAYSATTGTRKVRVLSNGSVETFRRDAFQPAVPAVLPSKHFAAMPAIHKWFLKSADNESIALNASYLAKFGATIVPLEISNYDSFSRIEQSLSFFLDASTMTTPTARIYLAQAPLMDLPRSLVNDVPTPDLVCLAGKGDLYDSSIWLGQAPTYTPLHRDPNPNLFVQLAGTKIVRLYKPSDGLAIFAKVQENVGGTASASMRGEEMMQGAEKKALEREVWEQNDSSGPLCWEAELSSGDGLFIPKGWWHSIKGVGGGMTGSVNWWFR